VIWIDVNAYFEEMVVLFAAVAVLGGVVGAYALKAWWHQRSRAMLALGVGLFLLSVGPAFAWLGLWIFDDIYMASMGCAVLLIAGFSCLLFAVRTKFV